MGFLPWGITNTTNPVHVDPMDPGLRYIQITFSLAQHDNIFLPLYPCVDIII